MNTKSITNQLVIGQRGTINNAQAPPLDVGSMHNFYYYYIITSLQTTLPCNNLGTFTERHLLASPLLLMKAIAI